MRRQAARARHRGQRGFTLIEIIVAVAIIGVIASALGGIFAVSYKMLQPGGPTTRLTGAHDLMILEQDLGRDGGRAACMKIAGTAYGSCSNGFAQVGCASGHFCIGWPQFSAAGDLSGSTCQVADYVTGANVTATRTEYSVSGNTVTTVGSVPLARAEPVTITVGTPATVSVTSTTPAYAWVRSVSVTITDNGPSNGASQTLALHPAATDPAGPSSRVVSGGTAPC